MLEIMSGCSNLYQEYLLNVGPGISGTGLLPVKPPIPAMIPPNPSGASTTTMTVEVHVPWGTFNRVPLVEVTVVTHPGCGAGFGRAMGSVSGFVEFTISPRQTKTPSTKLLAQNTACASGKSSPDCRSAVAP